MKQKILIAAPVRNRGWILEKYLLSLEQLDYPKEKIGFHFVMNDSVDKSEEILSSWKEKQESNYRYIRISRVDFGFPSDAREEGLGYLTEGFPRRDFYTYKSLSVLRNLILDFAALDDVGYLFTVDTDILIKPDLLNKLIDTGEEIVAALIKTGVEAYNFLPFDYVLLTDESVYKLNKDSGDNNHIESYLYKLYDRKDLREELREAGYGSYLTDQIISAAGKITEVNGKAVACQGREKLFDTLFQAKTTGAVTLISKEVFYNKKIRYFPAPTGEDEGFCYLARKEGIFSYVLPELQNHIIDKRIQNF